ncbi:MAG: DUF29 domain-containing protein [Microcystaceae cyanobacterium]
MNPTLYEKDYYLWIEQTAQLLKTERLAELDYKNLLEEIEDMGRNQRNAIESNLIVVFLHLLKWQYQPELQCGSWQGSIREHRRRILKSLKDSPSLRPYLETIWLESYQEARLQAADETGLILETFPEYCTFRLENILNSEYLPQNPEQ